MMWDDNGIDPPDEPVFQERRLDRSLDIARDEKFVVSRRNLEHTGSIVAFPHGIRRWVQKLKPHTVGYPG